MAEDTAQQEAQRLWEEVSRRIKEGDVRLPLWEAMEHCTPLTIDEEVLVLALPTEEYHRSGQLTQIDVRDEIRGLLRSITGRDLDYGVFEGETIEQWRAYRERRRAAEEASVLQRRMALETAAKRKSWDDLGQELQVKWGQLKERSLPWVLVRYMFEAFPMVAELEQNALRQSEDQHPLERRSLARMLQRIASHTDLPVTVVALEYEKYKEQRGLPSL